MMPSGRRRQYVTLEAAAPAVGDGDGGYTETYAPLVPPDAYAAIETAPGSQEQRVAGTAIASAAYRVTMPYRSDVTTKARIAFVDRGGRSHLLWVRGVDNPDQAGVVLELWCEEHIETAAPEAP